MKKIITTAITLLSLSLITYGFVGKKIITLITPQNSPEQEILGIWYMENSPSDKIEFLPNGKVKVYEDNILLYTDTYSISNSCDGQTTSNNELFLKRIDSEDGTEYCDYINGINENNNGVLSLTTSNQGKVVIYVR